MIELAAKQDREAVERLAKQVHALHVQWRPDLYTMPGELFPQELFSEMIRNRELYVAKIDGIVAGYCRLVMNQASGIGIVPRKVMLIDQLCVDEALQNRGIGTQMAAEIRVLAKAFGCTDLQLGVYPQNDAAVSFWQKCGFMIQSITMQRKV
jgi:ribosomal protein S18 acetylase RimI-like enzyme